MTTDAEADRPKRWHHALFDIDTAERLKRLAEARNIRCGLQPTRRRGPTVLGAECTDAEWTDLIRYHTPLAGG